MPSIDTAQPVSLKTDERGVMRVGNTRVRFDTVMTAWLQGSSPKQIVESFDVLGLADIYAVINYYLNHRAEVEAYLAENRQAGERLREGLESRFPPAGMRGVRCARIEEIILLAECCLADE